MIHSDSDSPRAIPTALPITYQMPDSKLAGANDLLVSLFPSPGNLEIPFLPPHCEQAAAATKMVINRPLPASTGLPLTDR